MASPWLKSYGKWVYRHAWGILIGALILSAVSVIVSSLYLKKQTGILDLYSDDTPTNRLFLDYSKKFGAVEYLILVFEGPEETSRRKAMEALAARLKLDPKHYIKDIFYKVDLDLFKSHAFQFLNENQAKDLLEQARSPDGGIHALFQSHNFSTFLDFLNRSLELGLKKGGKPKPDAAEQFGKLIQPLLLFRDFLQGQEMTATLITNRLEETQEEKRTLDEFGYLRTDDKKMHVMMIRPSDRKQDYKLAQGLVKWVREEIPSIEKQYPGIKIGVTGGPALNNDQFKISERDTTLASIFAFFSTSILFVLAFKSFARPFLGLVTLVINMTWVFGFATITIGHLNLFSLAFIVILVGQGTYYGVHVVARYEEELQRGRSVEQAIEETLSHIFGNVTTSAVTTAAAFYATTLVELKGFAELGWIAGSGILLSAISMQLVLPALLSLYDRRRPREKLLLARRNTEPGGSRWARAVLRHLTTYSYIGAGVMILVAAGGAYLFFSPEHGIRFDNNLLNLQAKNTEAVQYEKKLIETSLSPRAGIFMTASLPEARAISERARGLPTVQRVEWLGGVFPEGSMDSTTRQDLKQAILALKPAPLQAPDLNSLETELRRLKGNLEKVENQALGHAQGPAIIEKSDAGISAIDDILGKFPEPGADKATQRVIGDGLLAPQVAEFQSLFFKATRDMLRQAADAKPLQLAELPPEIRDRFLSPDGTYAVYAFPSVNIWEKDELTAFVGDLRRASPQVTGPPVMFFEILRLVHKDYFRAAFYAALAIFVIFLIDFRSLKYALICSIPKVLGVFSLFGLMSLWGLTFNTANMIALPMILGIGADNGVHMIHRFREEGEKNINFLFKSTGKALVITYLDSMTSFIGLAFATHQGVAQLGKVVVLGLTTCTMAGFLVLPAIMLIIARRKAETVLSPDPLTTGT